VAITYNQPGVTYNDAFTYAGASTTSVLPRRGASSPRSGIQSAQRLNVQQTRRGQNTQR